MPTTPQELKERLLKAVDQDHNVIDMVAVLDIFSTLERVTISRDILEQTRMGLTVNNIRRQTTNKDLAKRARQLVRGWQKLLSAPAPTAQNGEAKHGNGSVPHRNLNCVASTESKPNSPASRPCTPGLPHRPSGHVNSSRPATPAAPAVNASNTPTTAFHKSRLSPKSTSAIGISSPAFSHPSSGTASPQFALSTPHASNSCSRPSTPTETLSKKNVANKRKRRPESPADILEAKGNHHPKSIICDTEAEGGGGIKLTIKHDRMNGLVSHTDIVKNGADDCRPPPMKRTVSSSSLRAEEAEAKPSGSLERVQSTSALMTPCRTPKVKTTVQLMKDLHESGVKLRSSEVVTKIALNQIDKEDDSDRVSVVPAGAKPRPRKKPAMLPPTPSHRMLSQTKEERIQKFLQTSISPGPDADLNALLHLEPPEDVLGSEHPPDQPQDSCHEEKLADLERRELNSTDPCETDELTVVAEGRDEERQRFLDDPWSFLPPLDLNAIDFDDDQYVITDEDIHERSAVTSTTLHRLTDSQWVGVNGHFDHEDLWHDWMGSYSVPSFQGQLLHLLPYVDIERAVYDDNDDL